MASQSSKQEDVGQVVEFFLRELSGAVGDRIIGAILFGSHARKSSNDLSDIDIAIVVTDLNVEATQRAVVDLRARDEEQLSRISASVETYSRLKQFLEWGDPFAWVVCTDGVIVADSENLLDSLQKACREHPKNFERPQLRSYLWNKCSSHHQQALQALDTFFTNIQLSVMAGAQALAVQSNPDPIGSKNLVKWAEWSQLVQDIEERTSRAEIGAMESLIDAKKQLRLDEESPFQQVFKLLNTTSTVWHREQMGTEKDAEVS